MHRKTKTTQTPLNVGENNNNNDIQRQGERNLSSKPLFFSISIVGCVGGKTLQNLMLLPTTIYDKQRALTIMYMGVSVCVYVHLYLKLCWCRVCTQTSLLFSNEIFVIMLLMVLLLRLLFSVAG